jgi:hypothetical protein
VRIAQVAPLYEAVPPRLYGGTERIVAHLTDALVDLGHDVVLFASADARTRATLVPVRDQAIRLDPHPLKSDLAAHLSMLHELHRRADEFDVLHFHVDLVHFPFFEEMADRTLTTLHGRLDLKDLPEAYRRWPDYPLVSISGDQRRPLPLANWTATVPHGVRGDLYRFTAAPTRADSLARSHRCPAAGRPRHVRRPAWPRAGRMDPPAGGSPGWRGARPARAARGRLLGRASNRDLLAAGVAGELTSAGSRSRPRPGGPAHRSLAPSRLADHPGQAGRSHAAATPAGSRRSSVPRWQASASASVVRTTPPLWNRSFTLVSS